MDVADLRVFKSVVDEGGVIRAASKLHRVPSSVTTRIKQLETSIGVKLFHRERQRLHVVEEGGKASVRMLLPVALLILPALFVVVLLPAAAELTRLGGI